MQAVRHDGDIIKDKNVEMQEIYLNLAKKLKRNVENNGDCGGVTVMLQMVLPIEIEIRGTISNNMDTTTEKSGN